MHPARNNSFTGRGDTTSVGTGLRSPSPDAVQDSRSSELVDARFDLPRSFQLRTKPHETSCRQCVLVPPGPPAQCPPVDPAGDCAGTLTESRDTTSPPGATRRPRAPTRFFFSGLRYQKVSGAESIARPVPNGRSLQPSANLPAGRRLGARGSSPFCAPDVASGCPPRKPTFRRRLPLCRSAIPSVR